MVSEGNTLMWQLSKNRHSSWIGGAGRLQLVTPQTTQVRFPFPLAAGLGPIRVLFISIATLRSPSCPPPPPPGPSIPYLLNKDCLPLSPVLGTEVRPGQQTKLHPPRMSPCHLAADQQVREILYHLHKSWERGTRASFLFSLQGKGPLLESHTRF